MARVIAGDIELKRAREREQKKQSRASAALIQIPDCADRERRERLETDDIAWLMHYFGEGCGLDDPFTYDFTAQQREMIAAIRHAIKFGGDQAIAASRGEGKAVDVKTVLPTPDGWTTMGDVKVGDVLFDENGKQCRVTFATGVMHDHDCYSVRFSDGSEIIADADHLWRVWDSASRKSKVITTFDMKSTLIRDNKRGWTEWRYRIPVASAIETVESELPIKPYTLGAWLGDGTSAEAIITLGSDKQPIIGFIRDDGYQIERLPYRDKPNCWGYAIDRPKDQTAQHAVSFASRLKAANLLNNKHIPSTYLRASKEQRLALLQGLMDTDGCISDRAAPQCEFVTKFPALRDGMMELLTSLGIKATTHEKMVTLNGKQCGPYYRIRFTGIASDNVFRLPCKASRFKKVPPTKLISKSRQIVAIEPVDSVPVRCIQVDSPSHLYLAGDGMIPTHNTTLSERLLLKCALTGEVNYTVLFAASGQMADNSIDALRQAIAENDRLADDYPEVCVPVRELENTPQRANTQKASGNRHDNGQSYEMAELHYTWCGQELIFPKTPGSPSAGAIIATRGLDAAVRGLKKRGKRPKLAVIDDPDTEDTSRSEEQADKLARRIDAAIGGLGGQKRGIGRVLLTTLQSRIAVSYRFTDPKQKPSFKGRRYRYLIAPPNRMDLWDEYVMMRQQDLQQRDEHGTDLDPHCRRSHDFYATRRSEMDAGAVVSNENRYDPTLLPDGSQTELSALQHYFNEVARIGPEAVATELDNNPPEETAVVESGITPHRIQKQVSGLPRKTIPNGCTLLTQGIDVRKVALHWVVRAWKPDGTGYVVDYGIHEVVGTTYGSDEGVDAAVTKAIVARMTEMKETDYRTEEGGVIPVDLTLVDAGWRTDAVYAACLKIGTGIMPIMGFGKSSGCTQANFHDHFKRTADKKPGDGWFMSRKGNIWLVCSDADRWKAWEHDRWMTSPDKAGCLFVWGTPHDDPSRMSSDQKGHIGYAHHITNEREVEEPIRGKLVRRWKLKSDNNHYLDASCYANVAANMRGVRIASSRAAIAESVKQKVDPMNRPSLRELAGR